MLDHHAYYIEDSLSRAGEHEQSVREREGFLPHDPRFLVRQHEVLSIDEARALQAEAALKAGEGTTLFFIVASSIAHEAQQALLKLFEEPQSGLVFMLLVPHGALQPTLRSRFLEYPHKLVLETPLAKEASQFLSSPYKVRSEWVAAFLKQYEDDDARAHARDFMNALEVLLYPQLAKNREVRGGLQDIAHFRGYLSDRAPSLKMILEHLAATLPKLFAEAQEKSVRSGPLGQV